MHNEKWTPQVEANAARWWLRTGEGGANVARGVVARIDYRTPDSQPSSKGLVFHGLPTMFWPDRARTGYISYCSLVTSSQVLPLNRSARPFPTVGAGRFRIDQVATAPAKNGLASYS
jgi:hypothetical protein